MGHGLNSAPENREITGIRIGQRPGRDAGHRRGANGGHRTGVEDGHERPVGRLEQQDDTLMRILFFNLEVDSK